MATPFSYERITPTGFIPDELKPEEALDIRGKVFYVSPALYQTLKDALHDYTDAKALQTPAMISAAAAQNTALNSNVINDPNYISRSGVTSIPDSKTLAFDTARLGKYDATRLLEIFPDPWDQVVIKHMDSLQFKLVSFEYIDHLFKTFRRSRVRNPKNEWLYRNIWEDDLALDEAMYHAKAKQNKVDILFLDAFILHQTEPVQCEQIWSRYIDPNSQEYYDAMITLDGFTSPVSRNHEIGYVSHPYPCATIAELAQKRFVDARIDKAIRTASDLLSGRLNANTLLRDKSDRYYSPFILFVSECALVMMITYPIGEHRQVSSAFHTIKTTDERNMHLKLLQRMIDNGVSSPHVKRL
jgi:hypothetical protein